MLEIPESKTISLQTAQTLTGKKITRVFPPTSEHKFAFFNGDPAQYPGLLTGKQVQSARGHGMFVDILLNDDISITIGDGTHMRYHAPGEPQPQKYQLLIIFDDESSIAFSVAMYGGIWAYKGTFENPYHEGSLSSISPLDDAFNEQYFTSVISKVEKDLSLKALLATEQRIPGLGNGVLQDILFNAGMHPKRKKSTLSDFHKEELFHSLKVTLNNMTELGGRDTEKDFFGNAGGYKTLLSKNTLEKPCLKCGNDIVKEAYLGGAVYFCPVCQK